MKNNNMCITRRRMWKLLIHIIIVLFFINTWIGIIRLRGTLKHLGRVRSILLTRFLTNWNFFIQTLLFIGYLIHDVTELLNIDSPFMKRMKKTIDFYFYSVNAPTSIFISVVFWGMTLYDKTLIIPTGLENFLPLWLNHSLHTIIVVNVLLQAYYNKNSLTNFTRPAIASVVFYFCYFLCIYETYYEVDMWVYPFLGRIYEPYRLLLIAVLFLIYTVINITFNLTNKLYCDKIKTK